MIIIRWWWLFLLPLLLRISKHSNSKILLDQQQSFRSDLSSSSSSPQSLWFRNDSLGTTIECGTNYQMVGLSIVDGYIFQFLHNCSVIIYPPNDDDSHIINDGEELSLTNGRLYGFNKMLPENLTKLFCINQQQQQKKFGYSLNRKSKNMLILHYWSSKQSMQTTTQIDYLQLIIRNSFYSLKQENYESNNNQEVHFFMINNDGRSTLFITNESNDNKKIHHQYGIISNPLKTKKQKIGYFCLITSSDGKQQNHSYHSSITIQLQSEPCTSNWQLMNELFADIDFGFTCGEKLFLITSKQMEFFMLISQRKMLTKWNQIFTIQMATFDDVFICNDWNVHHINTNKRWNKTSATMITTTGMQQKLINHWKMVAIVLMIFIFTSLFAIFLYGCFVAHCRKRKILYVMVSSPSSPTGWTTIPSIDDYSYSNRNKRMNQKLLDNHRQQQQYRHVREKY